MTHELYFVNDGEIDIRCVTLMGFSAKPHESAIGMFGTGLKYAIAGILRLGGQIEIWSGQQCYNFCVAQEEIRGKQADVCYMEAHPNPPVPVPFTTRFGLRWEPWMFYRELWANARDEHGDVGVEAVEPAEGRTVIVVTCPELSEAHESASKFILASTPVWVGNGLEIHPNNNSGRVYYQGLSVFKAPDGRAPTHTYNITSHLSLTEDRQANAYGVELAIARGLLTWQHEDTSGLEQVLVATSGLESTFDLDWSGGSVTPSRVFLGVVAKLRREGLLSKDAAVVKYSSSRDGWDFNYVAMPLSEAEAAALDEIRSTVVGLGLATREELPVIHVSADVEDSDGWQELGGELYVAPESLGDVPKLTRQLGIWLLKRVQGKWADSEQVEWLFDRLLIVTGHVTSPPQEADFEPEVMPLEAGLVWNQPVFDPMNDDQSATGRLD